jgi:hypothetical protein
MRSRSFLISIHKPSPCGGPPFFNRGVYEVFNELFCQCGCLQIVGSRRKSHRVHPRVIGLPCATRSYEAWTCWVYSDEEYRQAVAEGGPHQIGLFALVPQLRVDSVGIIDLAIFVPGLNKCRPVVAIEADGHQFHERTVDQASNDRRRDRILQRSRIPVFRFTGTDVVRGSEEAAHEIVDYIDERARLSAWRAH